MDKIGIIAGWGRYPLVLAEVLKQQGRRTYCVGLKDHADPALADLCDEFQWVGLGQVGKALKFFHRSGVRCATMAGKVHKVILYRPGFWLRHLPDVRGVRTFYSHFLLAHNDRKDDTLLGAIVQAFGQDGITVAPATDYAPDLLVEEGCLTQRQPTSAQRKDIQFGWQLAKQIGQLDIGQSVVVRDRAVLAVEAIEGTDECIRRAGALCTIGEFTVVKVAKPQQDMRFDVPTVGIGTIETMVAAGARVLAIEAGRTILIDRARMLEFADRHKLVVIALGNPQS